MKRIFLWTAALLPLGMTAAVWTRLPEQAPIHWNLDGTVNYASVWVLWALAAVNPAIVALMRLLPRIDPRGENYRKFEGPYRQVCLLLLMMTDAVVLVTLVEALQPGTVNVGRLVHFIIGVVLMVTGNLMPKFRQTWFCGIKNAWTLSSERVWARTHRLGGYLYFLAGLINLLGLCLPPQGGFALLTGSLLTAVFVPNVMSYVWFRQERAAG